MQKTLNSQAGLTNAKQLENGSRLTNPILASVSG